MGEKDRRNKFLMVKVTEEEKRKIFVAARKCGMNVSSYIRWLSLRESK